MGQYSGGANREVVFFRDSNWVTNFPFSYREKREWMRMIVQVLVMQPTAVMMTTDREMRGAGITGHDPLLLGDYPFTQS